MIRAQGIYLRLHQLRLGLAIPAFLIGLAAAAIAQERNLQRAQVPTADEPDVDFRLLRHGQGRTAFDRDGLARDCDRPTLNRWELIGGCWQLAAWWRRLTVCWQLPHAGSGLSDADG